MFPTFGFIKRVVRHVDLVHRLCDAMGVDLRTGVPTGWMARALFRELDLHRASGREAKACACLLNGCVRVLTAAPVYCRDKASMDALAR